MGTEIAIDQATRDRGMRTKFDEEELSRLRDAYADIKVISIDHLPRFHRLFEQCSTDALRQLVNAKINFVSRLALNALIRGGATL